jgi:hypothetical protein
MAISSIFLAEVQKAGPRLDLWIEIEGIPYAFGLRARDASWYAAREVELRRDGILAALIDIPAGVEQELRPYDAESSIGQLTASLLDESTGTVRSMYANAARTDGWGRLGQDLGTPAVASATPGTVDVTMTAPAGTVVGSYLYVGRETMKVAALPGGGVVTVYRGMFRPPATLEARAYQHTAGDVVTLYPRFVRTRRVFFYSAPTGATDADKVARWAGTVQGAKLRKGLAGVDLTIESLEGELRAQCFSGQIRGKLAVGLYAPDGSFERSEAEPVPFADRLRLEPSSISGRAWVDGQRVAVRVGDELISGRLSLSNTEIVLDASSIDDARGMWGSPASEHHAGDDVSEVILVIGKAASRSVEERISRFSQGDNPLSVVLQVLLSVNGDGANGAYDVLPAGWGLGLDQSRVDVAGIEATRDRWLPFAREIRMLEEPFAARDFVASVLKAHLCYPVTLLDDRLTFRFLGPPMPDAQPRAVSGTVVLSPPTWADVEETVIGRAIVRCDQDPVEGTWRQTYKAEFQGPGVEAQEFYAGQFDAPEFEWLGQWSGNDAGASKFGARLCTDAETTALRFFDLLRDRRARPFPTIELETSYDQIDLHPGDLLAVSLDHVPDVETGGSSLIGAYCEVRRKTIDDRTGVVTLTLVQVPYGQQYRYIAPSGILSAGGTGNALALAAHEFTNSTGSADDASCFPVGSVVDVRSPDLVTSRGTRTVTGNTGGALTVNGAALTVTLGDVVVLAAYNVQPQAVKDRYAFLGDLGADAEHEYTP